MHWVSSLLGRWLTAGRSKWRMWPLVFTHWIEFHHTRRVVLLAQHTQLVRVVTLWHKR